MTRVPHGRESVALRGGRGIGYPLYCDAAREWELVQAGRLVDAVFEQLALRRQVDDRILSS